MSSSLVNVGIIRRILLYLRMCDLLLVLFSKLHGGHGIHHGLARWRHLIGTIESGAMHS
jgi:hypothetical protein